MNKIISFLNKIIEIINHSFKLIITICIIIYLIIFYQSTLNQRFQYFETTDNGSPHIVIFDTKNGEMYSPDDGSRYQYDWLKMSPFSKEQIINKKR